MKKIDQAIEHVETELEFVRNPGSYQDPEYYVRCKAQVDILEDVLYRLKQIKEGK